MDRDAPSLARRQELIDEALTYVYIGQHVRSDGREKRAGVLALDCERYHSEFDVLLAQDAIRRVPGSKRTANLEGFVTTAKGEGLAASLVRQRLSQNSEALRAEFGKFPRRLLRYLYHEMVEVNDPLPVMVVTLGRKIGESIGEYDVLPSESLNSTYRCLLQDRTVGDARNRLFRIGSSRVQYAL